MRFIKTYEAFNYNQEQYNSDVSKYGKEYADFILKSSSKGEKVIKPTIDNYNKDMISDYIEYIGWGEYRNQEVPIEEIEENLFNIFDYLNNTNPIILKRMLAVDTIDDIDENDLGRHYVLPDITDWWNIVDSAGIAEEDDGKELYIITVGIKKEMVDIDYTIKTNIEWGLEEEVTLKLGYKPKIKNIERYE